MIKRVNVSLLEITREHLADICHKTQTYDDLIEELIAVAGPNVGINVRRKSNPARTPNQDRNASFRLGNKGGETTS